jgi:hypothetical protein
MLISSTTETWSSRLQMEEKLKFGTSTNSQRLSELETTTSHGTSNQLVEQRTCKSGAPTLDGSKSSNFKEKCLSIQLTTRFLKFKALRMKKVKPLRLATEQKE